MIPTLVIGDCHGHYDRLISLLEQEGIVAWNEAEGCHRRIRHDVETVQLGDLGQFDERSTAGDLACYEAAKELFDVVLWGNHDRAVIDEAHAFDGYRPPDPSTRLLMRALVESGRMRLAHAAHGWLLTHAGLHLAFRDQRVNDRLKTDPAAFAEWIEAEDRVWMGEHSDRTSLDALAIRDAVGPRRGGRAPAGGILWRDIEEKLYVGYPQVFGHSADRKSHSVRYCTERTVTRKLERLSDPSAERLSYCIDIGGKHGRPEDNCLMGIWLPEQRIVRVDLGAAVEGS